MTRGCVARKSQITVITLVALYVSACNRACKHEKITQSNIAAHFDYATWFLYYSLLFTWVCFPGLPLRRVWYSFVWYTFRLSIIFNGTTCANASPLLCVLMCWCCRPLSIFSSPLALSPLYPSLFDLCCWLLCFWLWRFYLHTFIHEQLHLQFTSICFLTRSCICYKCLFALAFVVVVCLYRNSSASVVYLASGLMVKTAF